LIRNNIIPEIQKKWPFIDKSLKKISIKATKAAQVLEEVAMEDLNKIQFSKNVLDMDKLKSFSSQRQQNLVVFWLNHFNNIRLSPGQEDQIFSLMNESSEGSSIFNFDKHDYTSDIKIIFSSKEIRIIDNHLLEPLSENMSLEWDLKDLIKIPTGELSVEESFGKGLDKKFIGSDIKIKARVGGERCKPFGRSKSQKIKNLFQEFEVPDWKRDYIPIIYIDEKIAAVGDLWVCDEFHTNINEHGISIKWNHNF
jgi:tRNA(Ile)-lysidine synthase